MNFQHDKARFGLRNNVIVSDTGEIRRFRIGQWVRILDPIKGQRLKMSTGRKIPKGLNIDFKDLQVGIINELGGDTATVHVVNEDGDTILIIGKISLNYLRQASYSDIPVSRRPDRKFCKALGYL